MYCKSAKAPLNRKMCKCELLRWTVLTTELNHCKYHDHSLYFLKPGIADMEKAHDAECRHVQSANWKCSSTRPNRRTEENAKILVTIIECSRKELKRPPRNDLLSFGWSCNSECTWKACDYLFQYRRTTMRYYGF